MTFYCWYFAQTFLFELLHHLPEYLSNLWIHHNLKNLSSITLVNNYFPKDIQYIKVLDYQTE